MVVKQTVNWKWKNVTACCKDKGKEIENIDERMKGKGFGFYSHKTVAVMDLSVFSLLSYF